MSAPAVISLDPKADWMTKADHVIGALAAEYRRSGKTFTADDLHKSELIDEPEDSNWPGLAFKLASRSGEIVKTHAYKQSTRPGRKGSILAVWRAAT